MAQLDRRRLAFIVLTMIGLVVSGLPGCSDEDDEGVIKTTESTATTATTATTSVDTTTSQATSPGTSIDIAYECGNGESGSTEIPTDDIEEIDDIVNTIDLCEFRGGLTEISFNAPCPSGDRDVTVTATDGGLPDLATLDLCENP